MTVKKTQKRWGPMNFGYLWTKISPKLCRSAIRSSTGGIAKLRWLETLKRTSNLTFSRRLSLKLTRSFRNRTSAHAPLLRLNSNGRYSEFWDEGRKTYMPSATQTCTTIKTYTSCCLATSYKNTGTMNLTETATMMNKRSTIWEMQT